MAELPDILQMLANRAEQEETTSPPMNPDIKAELLVEAVHQYERVHHFEKYQIIRQKRPFYNVPAVDEPAIFWRDHEPGVHESGSEYQVFNALVGLVDQRGGLHFVLVDIQRFEPYTNADMAAVIAKSLEKKT